MFDKELVVDILKNIIWSIEQITRRVQSIKTSDDFIRDDHGLEKLDRSQIQYGRQLLLRKEVDCG